MNGNRFYLVALHFYPRMIEKILLTLNRSSKDISPFTVYGNQDKNVTNFEL